MLILYQHRKWYLIFNIVKGDGAPAGQRYIGSFREMNINNYECDGQMSIEDFLVSNNQEVKRLLHSGEVVFGAIKGDVERHVVTDEHWYIEHLKTYGNRTRVHGAYGVVLDSNIGNRVFFEKEKAEKIAEIYLQNHEVIRASEINPIETVAYSYKTITTGKKMIAFYSVLDNGMVYVKGFTTFEHLMLKEHVKKEIKKFIEQQEFKYSNPKKIEYIPKFKNMYRIKMKYDWDYAEARHSYAVG